MFKKTWDDFDVEKLMEMYEKRIFILKDKIGHLESTISLIEQNYSSDTLAKAEDV